MSVSVKCSAEKHCKGETKIRAKEWDIGSIVV